MESGSGFAAKDACSAAGRTSEIPFLELPLPYVKEIWSICQVHAYADN